MILTTLALATAINTTPVAPQPTPLDTRLHATVLVIPPEADPWRFQTTGLHVLPWKYTTPSQTVGFQLDGDYIMRPRFTAPAEWIKFGAPANAPITA